MCERYVVPSQSDAEREFEPAHRWWQFAPSFNVWFPQYVPVIRAHQGSSEGVMMRWGLIPPEAEGVPPQNEQATFPFEELGQTPDSREPWLNSQRCILPMSGYYLWQLTSRGYKQPHFAGVVDRTAFGVAAFWTRSVTEEDDDVIESCAIITVPANSMLEQLTGSGGRMPAILRRRDYSAWLTGTPVQAKAVLHTYPANWMHAHAVSPRVNSLKQNDVGLIRPVGIREQQQQA